MAFLLLAALPLLLTVAVCLAEFVPGYQQARTRRYASQLSTALGCTAEVGSVELLAPDHFILHGVKLFHPENSELIAQVQKLDVFQSPAGYALRLINCNLAGKQLSSTYRLLHEQVLCRPAKRNQATVAWLDGLAIESDSGVRTQFRNARLELRRMTSETQANFAFGLEGIGGQLAKISFARRHASTQPTTHLMLSSGGQRLPAHWISHFAPQFAIAGEGASLTGQFELDYGIADWSLKGEGQLSNLDTSAWSQRPMLSGSANLSVTSFSLSDQGLDHVHGQLAIKDGRINDVLFHSANDIGIKPAAAVANSRNSAYPFTQVALEFALDARGLVLKAGLPNGCVATDELGSIAEQYYWQVVPMANLVTALSKATDLGGNSNDLVQSPTVRRLVRWLPKPVSTIASEQTNHQANATDR